MPNLRGAGDQTQSFFHARQALHQLTYTPGPSAGLIMAVCHISLVTLLLSFPGKWVSENCGTTCSSSPEHGRYRDSRDAQTTPEGQEPAF